jgi:hypothetical protein
MRKKLDEVQPQNDNAAEQSIGALIDRAMTLGALRKLAMDRSRLAKFDECDAASRPPHVFCPGDRVVMTGRALNSMGVKRGGDVAREWSVLACSCDLCRTARFVCTDQRAADGDGWRHIATRALRLKSQPSCDDIDNMPMRQTEIETGGIQRGIDRAFRRYH